MPSISLCDQSPNLMYQARTCVRKVSKIHLRAPSPDQSPEPLGIDTDCEESINYNESIIGAYRYFSVLQVGSTESGIPPVRRVPRHAARPLFRIISSQIERNVLL